MSKFISLDLNKNIIPNNYDLFNIINTEQGYKLICKNNTYKRSDNLLVIVCYCHQNKEYAQYLSMLLFSIYATSDDKLPDILLITNTSSRSTINTNTCINMFNYDYLLCDEAETFYDYAVSRTKMFKYKHIDKYQKIMYIDCDILCLQNINKIFNLEIEENKIYAVEEGNIDCEYHASLFSEEEKQKYKDLSMFSSGVMLFKYSSNMKNLFTSISKHIADFRGRYIKANDQPFIVYHAVTNGMYNNKLLHDYVTLNHNGDKVLIHFPGYKESQMNLYLNTFVKLFTDLDQNKSGKIIKNEIDTKKYDWYHSRNQNEPSGHIQFLYDGVMNSTWGNGVYEWINYRVLKTNWGYGHLSHYFIVDNELEIIHSFRPQEFIFSKALISTKGVINPDFKPFKCTLRKWQNLIKSENELIVQASLEDGSDGIVLSSVGMSYHYANKNTNIEDYQLGTHENLVLCAFNEINDFARRVKHNVNRINILKTLSDKNIFNKTISPDKYYEELPNYKFAISPEGNGIDCHRHYESLLAGCIPIVEDNNLIRKKYGECPILYTTNYSEINQDYLEKKYLEMLDTEYDFSKLFLSYWSEEERKSIMQRGNFWCNRLAGKKFYN